MSFGAVTPREIFIREMVYTRLPYLESTDPNDTILDMYILETMFELEMCLKKDKDLLVGDPTKVGVESNYAMLEKSLIADVVSVYLLIRQSTIATTADITGGGTSGKVLTGVKAGSVEVEWEIPEAASSGSTGLLSNAAKLMELYMNSSTRRALQLGCTLIWSEDGLLSIGFADNGAKYPLLVVSHDEFFNRVIGDTSSRA